MVPKKAHNKAMYRTPTSLLRLCFDATLAKSNQLRVVR